MRARRDRAPIVALIGVLGLFSIWWLVFVVGVLVAIFFHELGHFATAGWTGMKATQFFIGFGPRAGSFRRGETEYGVRALPLGAFVRIIGMNQMDDVAPEDVGPTYMSKSFPRRLLVISAGSLMHMLLAIVLLFTVYVADGEVVRRDGAEIASVEPTGPAFIAGLRTGDVVVSIDGAPVAGSSDLGRLVQSNDPGDTLSFDVLRDGSTITVPVGLGEHRRGVTVVRQVLHRGVERLVLRHHRALRPGGGRQRGHRHLSDLVGDDQGRGQGAQPGQHLHAPERHQRRSTPPTTLVGVTGLSDDVGDSEGIIGILFLLAVSNVFVGVFNMFPLLPLDGGHAAIAIYERLRERGGQRYHADVAKLMPFAMAVMTVLLFLFMSGLYLDITDPVG